LSKPLAPTDTWRSLKQTCDKNINLRKQVGTNFKIAYMHFTILIHKMALCF